MTINQIQFNQYLQAMKVKHLVLLLSVFVIPTLVLGQKTKTEKSDSLAFFKEIQVKYQKLQKDLSESQIKNGFLYTTLAVEKYSQEKYGVAIEYADSAIQLGQGGFALEIKGRSYFALNRFKDAAETLEESVVLTPGYLNNYILGVSYYKISPTKNATRIIDAMLAAQKFRADTMSYYYLGRSYYEIENYELSAAAFETLLTFQRSYEVFFSCGLAYYAIQKYDKAVDKLQAAYRIKDVDPVLLKAYAVSLIRTDRLEQGEKILKELIKLKKT